MGTIFNDVNSPKVAYFYNVKLMGMIYVLFIIEKTLSKYIQREVRKSFQCIDTHQTKFNKEGFTPEVPL